MPLDFAAAMSVGARDLPYAYDRTRTMLYALAIGLGRDPLDRRELSFVYEADLVAVPTLASVLAWGAFDVRKLGVDYPRVLHGEQRLTLHTALPPAARLLADVRTLGVHDKGEGKGALVGSQVAIRDADSGRPLCTLETTHFARGDGGFSARDGRDSGAPRAPRPTPDRPADAVVHMPTELHQALLYRLLGDWNPLHADPDVAAEAGFERPILHGLCTYGVCCHAILRWAGYRADRLRQFDVRFSAPVFPGETLRVEIWSDGPDVSFRAFAEEREVLVINNGYCRLGATDEADTPKRAALSKEPPR